VLLSRDADEREEQHHEREAHGQEVEGVGENARPRKNAAEVRKRHPHNPADAAVVAQTVGADEGAHYGSERRRVDSARVDVAGSAAVGVGMIVSMRVVWCMSASRFESMLDIVRQEVEPAKDKKYGHGEARENFGPLQAEGVADAGAPPDLKVPKNVNGNADSGRPDVKKDQVGQRCQSKRPLGTEEDVNGHSRMATAPIQASPLVAVHASPCFFQSRYRQGGGQDGRRPGWRFLEELVLRADRTVLVAMATTLAYVLERRARVVSPEQQDAPDESIPHSTWNEPRDERVRETYRLHRRRRYDLRLEVEGVFKGCRCRAGVDRAIFGRHSREGVLRGWWPQGACAVGMEEGRPAVRSLDGLLVNVMGRFSRLGVGLARRPAVVDGQEEGRAAVVRACDYWWRMSCRLSGFNSGQARRHVLCLWQTGPLSVSRVEGVERGKPRASERQTGERWDGWLSRVVVAGVLPNTV